jgi:predicted NBD/HSP70 family sugar kinase
LLPTFLRTRWAALSSALAVEVGGSSVQSAVLTGGTVEFVMGAAPATEATPYGLAAPGLVVDGRVLGAHHLGWMDVEAWRELGYDRRPDVSLNDAEAGAFGEWLLRDGEPDDLLYIGIGTGVGAVRIAGGELVREHRRARPADAVGLRR